MKISFSHNQKLVTELMEELVQAMNGKPFDKTKIKAVAAMSPESIVLAANRAMTNEVSWKEQLRVEGGKAKDFERAAQTFNQIVDKLEGIIKGAATEGPQTAFHWKPEHLAECEITTIEHYGNSGPDRDGRYLTHNGKPVGAIAGGIAGEFVVPGQGNEPDLVYFTNYENRIVAPPLKIQRQDLAALDHFGTGAVVLVDKDGPVG